MNNVLTLGQNYTLGINEPLGNFEFTSSHPEVLTVSAAGIITTHQLGSSVLTVRYKPDGAETRCLLSVVSAPAGGDHAFKQGEAEKHAPYFDFLTLDGSVEFL